MPSVADIRRYEEEGVLPPVPPLPILRQLGSAPPPEPAAPLPPAPPGLERARWAWQEGPPYTFPGNPPIAQEVATAFNLAPSFSSFIRSVPVEVGAEMPPLYGGEGRRTNAYFDTRNSTMYLPDDFSIRSPLHEFVHAWDMGNSWIPRRSLSPSWLLTGFRPGAEIARERGYASDPVTLLQEALPWMAQRYAPSPSYLSLRPPENVQPFLSQLFNYNVPALYVAGNYTPDEVAIFRAMLDQEGQRSIGQLRY